MQLAPSHKAQTRRKWRQGLRQRRRWRRQSPKWREKAARPARRAATGLQGLKGEYFTSPCSGPAFCGAGGSSVRSVGRLSLARPSSRPSPRGLPWVWAAKAVRSAVGRPRGRFKDCSFVLGPPLSRFLQAKSNPEASGPASARGDDGAGLRASEPASLRPAHLSSDLLRGG